MKGTVLGLVILLFYVTFFGEAQEGRCTSIDDHDGINLDEAVCYIKCLSDALNKLYTDGEQKLLVNEEVYANASRILDDMEGKTDESTKYLSVVSSEMGGESEKLEKLISYGNTMGDLVAKVGGLFAEVNESLRAVREVLPSALIKANKYYTAVAEITRTVWDDVKAVDVNSEEKDKCESEALKGVTELPTACGDQACPLREGLNESTLKKYKSGCIEVNVMTQSGKVSTCFNLPRNNLYMSSAVEGANGEVQWVKSTPNEFQFILEVQKIFTPLIGPFGAGQLPSVLLATLSNITFFRSRFDEVHSSFTSLLLGTNLTDNLNSTDFAI